MSIAAPTFDDLFALGAAEAATKRPDLNVDEGYITEMLIAGAAAMGDHVVGYAGGRFKATFVDGAAADDLTDLADDHWQVPRGEASAATGQVTITRPEDVSAPAGSIASGAVVKTERDASGNEVSFTLNNGLVWMLGESGAGAAKTVNVTCTVTGSTGDVDGGTITRFGETPFDPLLEVTNASATGGGNPEEEDPALRDRVRATPRALRRAILDALEYGAKTVSGVRQATAVEDSEGIVSLYVSDESGSSSQPMITAVALEMRNWRAAGSVVNVYGGQPTIVSPIRVKLYVRPGVDALALVAAVKKAIVAELQRLKLGEILYRGAIERAVRNVSPDGIARVDVELPLLDVEPSAAELLRTTEDDVEVS